MSKKGKVTWNDNGSVTMTFDTLLPHEVRKGHRPHRSGAGIHEDKRRKKVRIRGNNAKRAWLEE